MHPSLLSDLLSHAGPHGINGDYRAGDVYCFQCARDGSYLIGFVFKLFLSNAKTVLAYPDIEQIQALVLTGSKEHAPLFLAIYNDLFLRQAGKDGMIMATKTSLKLEDI